MPAKKVSSKKAPKSGAKKVLDSIISVIIDESGSMGPCRADTIGGFNVFIKEQKAVKGKATLTLTKFNDSVSIPYADKDIKDVEDLTELAYCPNGCTALFDAIGKTINAIEAKLTPKTKKNKILVVIMTDGAENASREYNSEAIKKLIEGKTAEGNWSFVFLGANQDAILSAKSLGVLHSNSANYSTNNMKGTMHNLSVATCSYRSAAGGQSANFFDGKKNI